MKIYSRTGDKGETGLAGGARVRKTDPKIEALGAMDEANAALGVARSTNLPEAIDVLAEWVQSKLFDIGAALAADPGKPMPATISPRDVQRLEEAIDSMTALLEPLRNFILPGGSVSSAALHVARTVCRRAERRIVELREACDVESDILRFVNRLSDWLFVAARLANHESGVADVLWKGTEES